MSSCACCQLSIQWLGEPCQLHASPTEQVRIALIKLEALRALRADELRAHIMSWPVI